MGERRCCRGQLSAEQRLFRVDRGQELAHQGGAFLVLAEELLQVLQR